MYDAPTNYFILLLTLNMTMLAEHRPKDPAKFFDGGQKIHLKIYSPPRSFKFFTAIEKSSCRFFKMQELTGSQKSASPKN